MDTKHRTGYLVDELPLYPELDGIIRSAWEWMQAHPRGF